MLIAKDSFPIEEVDYNYLKSVLSNYKNKRVKINSMLRKGEIIRVKKGLYVLGEPYTKGRFYRETLSNLIYGPSYISLEYALSFYGMIPERTETITAVTNKRNKVFNTPVGCFTYRYIRPDLYPHGITIIGLNAKHNITIASREKVLADVLYFGPELTSIKEMEEYLLQDLRLDERELGRLKRSDIGSLAKKYGGNCLLFEEYFKENYG
jgi:predicted transcriptional regulator of viral defense system